MNYIYYVWIDLIVNDILAVKQDEATPELLNELEKLNINPVKITSPSTLEAIQKYKSTHNIHSAIFKASSPQVKLH